MLGSCGGRGLLLCHLTVAAIAAIVATAAAIETCQWHRRETHHTVSSVQMADTSLATLWAFAPKHLGADDPINTVLQYKPLSLTNNTSNNTASPGFPPRTKPWKYEFACTVLPKMAVSADGILWAVACPSQNVRLHDRRILTSSHRGSVTLFRWLPAKGRARIVQTIHGGNANSPKSRDYTTAHHNQGDGHEEADDEHEHTLLFGVGHAISMSADGTTLAVIASAASDTSNKKRTSLHNSHNRYALHVYHCPSNNGNNNNSTSLYGNHCWKSMGQVIPDIAKAIVSDDGTRLATMTQNKILQVYHYHKHTGEWVPEDFVATNRWLRGLSLSSMSLAGNGNVISLLQSSRRGPLVNIYRRSQSASRLWQLDSSISVPPTTRHTSSSFGWVTSLSGDGNRIAIAEPSWNRGTGGVYVYDYSTGHESETGSQWNPSIQGDISKDEHHHPTIPAMSPSRRDSFGRHVQLSASGQHLIVKALSYTTIYEYNCQPATDVDTESEAQPGQGQQHQRDEL